MDDPIPGPAYPPPPELPELEASAGDAMSRGFDWVTTMLVNPFDWRKWFIIGLVGFLASLGEGGGGGIQVPQGVGEDSFGAPVEVRDTVEAVEEWIGEHKAEIIAIIVGIGVLGCAVGLFVIWISSRFRAILFDLVARNDTGIRRSWRATARAGNSYFLVRFRIVLGIVGLLLLGTCIVLPIGLVLLLAGGSELEPGLLMIPVAGVCCGLPLLGIPLLVNCLIAPVHVFFSAYPLAFLEGLEDRWRTIGGRDWEEFDRERSGGS